MGFMMFCLGWVFCLVGLFSFFFLLFLIIHLTESFVINHKYPKGTKYQLPHGVSLE